MRVNHPTLPGVSKNVPDELVEKWLGNGWTPVEAIGKKPVAKKSVQK